MKVLIAGAGLAGLFAGWTLAKEGHEVIVFEAKDRVGGRAWSHAFSNGAVIERGGEFITSSQHLIRSVCAEFELPLIAQGVAFVRRWTQEGDRVSSQELQADIARLEDVASSLAAQGRYDVPLTAAYERAFGEDYRKRHLFIRAVTSLCTEPESVSAASYVSREKGRSTVYMEHSSRVLGGNQRIATELHRRMGESVVLRSPVRAVSQNSSGVEFTLDNGETVAGDAAILAVPLPLLRELDIRFPLPVAMRQALDARLMGQAAKLSATTTGAAPARGVMSNCGFWWSWNSLPPDDDIGHAAVTSFAGTKATLAALNVNDGGATWLEALRKMRPDLDILGEPLVTNWSSDPWTKGAYSYPGIDWEPAFAQSLSEPVGRVSIAGEHTVEPTMNGALVSAQECTRRLLGHQLTAAA